MEIAPDWGAFIASEPPYICPRCGLPTRFGPDGQPTPEHFAESCPTMYQERMLTAFLDRLERMLGGGSVAEEVATLRRDFRRHVEWDEAP